MLLDYSIIKTKNISSKFLQEYVSLKDDNKDCILLVQVGDFCESYFYDAKIFAETAGVILTSRFYKELGNVAMAGVPKQSVNLFIKKLLNQKIDIKYSMKYMTM